MTLLYNNSIFKDRRRELRRRLTEAERILWAHVRNDKLGHHFWRQYSVGPYILDFYSPNLRLAIELDGRHHAETDNKAYDQEREKYLQNRNITMIRFWNSEVVSGIENVVDRIRANFPPLTYKRGQGEIHYETSGNNN